ncbi:MAG: mannose-6-phosphate isomerase [Novosphingobium sp. 32-60-15]|uniref:class I mannose-6-phosphate isomerase n=1 Tax=unclassified Novosphingobium TaxID=2644732 RepID=UPI000BCEC33F|nr:MULTISPECIES: class I mannose-6-phosphate isomerase [unclassified Novosphingobium]OYX62021.1 MAG: mannose-6-phosphate isomerase [Novosphingobium sp. 32-60-15]
MTLLTKRLVEKPWGVDELPAPFVAPKGQRIGEVWFEPPPEMPNILVKYIFTSEKLSVQVHPSDAQAIALGETDGGKEECWLVIAAEPGATLGIGFKHPLDAEAMRKAALDGSIEDLMMWHPVQRGDFFYIPAGTVHAIGAGVSLIEVQQTSDITYRLFDYGRPRELHLDKGIKVANGAVYGAAGQQHNAMNAFESLASGPYFSVEQVNALPNEAASDGCDKPFLVIPITGSIDISGAMLNVGDCAMVMPNDAVVFSDATTALVVRDKKLA